MYSENTSRILLRVIDELNIPVTKQTVLDELDKYPDNSGILTISNALDNWNVANSAYEVPTEELKAPELPKPFLACLENGNFLLVYDISDKTATVSANKGTYLLPLDEFEEHYSGVILAFQKDEFSGEIDYNVKKRKEIVNKIRNPFIFSGLTFMISVILLLQPGLTTLEWRIYVLMFLKLFGMATSIVLLMQSVNANNSFVQKICGTDNNKSCNAILSSKAAKLTEELSWSEVGFFYFAGTGLTLLFSNGSAILIHWLAIFNVLCLPYTFYSIYYQWRIAKQWCMFCCTIQGLLWVEFVFFAPYLFSNFPMLNFTVVGILTIALLVPIVLWVFIKPMLLATYGQKNIKQQLYWFKYNAGLFNALLEKQEKHELLNGDACIELGSTEAKYTVTLVSNPMCKHCAKAHKVLGDWLESDENDNKLQVVFSYQESKNGRQAKVVRHLMSMKNEQNDNDTHQALADWYSETTREYDKWASKHPLKQLYPSDELPPSVQQSITAQREWCESINVTHTPVILVNGYRLPPTYQLEDIKYILKN